MKFTVSKNELNESLKIVSRAAAVKTTTPILAGIFLKAESSCLELQANDFNISIAVKIPASVEEYGQIVIAAKNLVEICAKLNGETVTIENKDNNVLTEIVSDAANFSVLTMDADDFPQVPKPETENNFALRTETFRKLVEYTHFAAAVDIDSRPIFKGIYFKRENNSITAAATNTHRVAIKTEELYAQCDGECDFIVSAKSMLALSKMFNGLSERIDVESNSKFVTFTCGNIFVALRKIEGQFPPYGRVIPTETTTTATVDFASFKNAVDRVNVISKTTEFSRIDFNFETSFDDNGEIKISSNSSEVGKAEEIIAAEVKGQDLKISFNVNYITDVLKVLKVLNSEKIAIKLSKSLSPVDIREVDNDNFIYVVTPIRTAN